MEDRKKIRTYKDLDVYKLAYELAMEIFRITRTFPKAENYSLVSQIFESSRSVPANIAEGFAKRRYENVFKRHLNDALGSSHETKVWLDFSLDCGYVSNEKHNNLTKRYTELGAKIFRLTEKWQSYI